MLVRKMDGREGERKAGMKDARVDEVWGEVGKGKRRAKVGKRGKYARSVQRVCNSELR